MKKQTAVEWLVKELNQKIDFIPINKWDEIKDIVNQAKAMEKTQILDAYVYGSAYGTDTKQGFSAVNYFESIYKKS